MVFYYSVTQKTKIYAEILGAILDHPLHSLQSSLDTAAGFGFMAKALWYTLTKKAVPVTNMPESYSPGDEEIYICCPVWGGYPAAPIRCFLQNAPLKGKKVHMILTASMSHVKYTDKAKMMIAEAGCIPGNVEVFATSDRAVLDRDIIEAHIRHLMFGESIAEDLK
ncbi:MAG: hypothetical protein FWD03_01395 [Defluviitaleaceae bacterium]|nr:hypothetical protein [Defluviitaleaceae bacterium]